MDKNIDSAKDVSVSDPSSLFDFIDTDDFCCY